MRTIGTSQSREMTSKPLKRHLGLSVRKSNIFSVIGKPLRFIRATCTIIKLSHRTIYTKKFHQQKQFSTRIFFLHLSTHSLCFARFLKKNVLFLCELWIFLFYWFQTPMVRRPSSVSAQDAHPPFDQLANTCENHKYDVDFFSFIVRIMPSMSQG